MFMNTLNQWVANFLWLSGLIGLILLADLQAQNSGFTTELSSATAIEELKTILAEKFKTYQTYQADIKEHFEGKLRQGKLFIQKPHSVRLTYYNKDEVELDVFGSEKTLYVHLPKYSIVYEEILTNEAVAEFVSIETSSLDFLLMHYNFDFAATEELELVLDEAAAKIFNVTTMLTPSVYHLALRAKDVARGLAAMTVWMQPDGLIIRSRSESIDKKIVDVYFYNIILDESFPKNTFEFVFDPDVKVIKNSFK